MPKNIPQSTSNNDRLPFFQRIADTIPAMVAVYNIQTGQYLYVNSIVTKLLGYTKNEFITGGTSFVSSLIHPEDLDIIRKKNNMALQEANIHSSVKRLDQKIVQFEYRMKHKNGHYVWLRTEGSVFQRGKNKHVEIVLNISTDITDRKLNEEDLYTTSRQLREKVVSNSRELAQSLRDLRNIKYALDQSSIVAITDRSGVIQYANDKFVEISQYSREELIGKTHRVINSKYHSKEFIKNLWDTIIAGKVWHGEIKNRAKNGRYYWVDTTITPLLGENGQPNQFIAIRNDVTERKNLEQKKDEFISVASHELKTPLTSAKAYTQLLHRFAEKHENPMLLTYTTRMNEQMRKLSQLVYDLLDTTRIQAGRLSIIPMQFDIQLLLEEVIQDVKAVSNGQILRLTSVRPLTIWADRDKISQVVQNLLTNAVKYSPRGGEITAGYIKTGDVLTVFVKDCGLGISDEDKNKIFQRFYQVESAIRRHSPSLGLGLYISQEIISRHNGKLWVESQVGRGSTFYFSLPVKQ